MGYQYIDMSQAQIEAFLEAPRFAVVGTNRRDGAPQMTPVWYLYDDGKIYISIYVNSAKYRNLSRDPRISICIVGDNPDARAVMIYGTAEIILDDSAWSDDIHWRLNRLYFDSDEEARSFMASTDEGGPGALVAVTPEKIIAQDFN